MLPRGLAIARLPPPHRWWRCGNSSSAIRKLAVDRAVGHPAAGRLITRLVLGMRGACGAAELAPAQHAACGAACRRRTDAGAARRALAALGIGLAPTVSRAGTGRRQSGCRPATPPRRSCGGTRPAWSCSPRRRRLARRWRTRRLCCSSWSWSARHSLPPDSRALHRRYQVDAAAARREQLDERETSHTVVLHLHPRARVLPTCHLVRAQVVLASVPRLLRDVAVARRSRCRTCAGTHPSRPTRRPQSCFVALVHSAHAAFTHSACPHLPLCCASVASTSECARERGRKQRAASPLCGRTRCCRRR